ncbi:MAG: hypothetical protein GXP29_14465 [Planctomycetes bacterium]|nr:hypothetical protein [Planctomycetota bacterium]
MHRSTKMYLWVLPAAALGLIGVACITSPPIGGGGDGNGDGGDGSNGNGDSGTNGVEHVFNNTTDRTNSGASWLGSGACRACHPEQDAEQSIHGHAFKLNRIEGEAPVFPAEGVRAGVPNPPDGIDWSQVSYVIGGYTKKARFIDLDGFIYITGTNGLATQWNLDFPPNGTEPGFVNYETGRTTPKPYDSSCFVCHTTGPEPPDEDNPTFQDNRPGLAGTWQEAGIQCEACHGPGSNHVPNTSARDAFVDTSASFCGECHNRPFDSDGSVILAANGFIKHHEQYPELLASGGHATLDCVTCHDPHVSVLYDRENAMRQECLDCHPDQGMALHRGKTFVRGSYVESLSCESCHMTYATRSGSNATEAVVGELGRMGDTRTHIFRINTSESDYTSFFNEDMSEVVKDSQGRAAVTVDFVCLRCHNGLGSAFDLTVRSASSIANNIHSAGQ